MKILFIEDDQHISELLSATLSAHHYAVDAIADGEAGLDLATQWNYDLILLDVMLPKLNGIEVCRRLRAQDCQTPILMLTIKDANEDIVAGLDAGADDYLAKSCDSTQLLARVRALLRRSRGILASPVLSWERLCLDPASAQVSYNQTAIALRPKEYNLLELFLRHPQRIFSRSAIIDHLWSMDDAPVEGSITNLIKDLRQRLKSAGMEADLIETVYGLGYRLKPPPTADNNPRQTEDLKLLGHETTTSNHFLATDRDAPLGEQQGVIKIQNIAQRFRQSLKQRLVELEMVERSLQANNLNLQQQQAARTEAHKLAGGLGTFGCARASEIAQALEHLLQQELSQQPRLVNQFSQLLGELKQELSFAEVYN